MAASRCGTIEVIGRVPKELTGRFLRIGPNPIDELDQVRLLRYHWFAVPAWRMASGCAMARRNGSAAVLFLTGRRQGPQP